MIYRNSEQMLQRIWQPFVVMPIEYYGVSNQLQLNSLFNSLFGLISMILNLRITGPSSTTNQWMPSQSVSKVMVDTVRYHDALTMGIPMTYLMHTLFFFYFFLLLCYSWFLKLQTLPQIDFNSTIWIYQVPNISCIIIIFRNVVLFLACRG